MLPRSSDIRSGRNINDLQALYLCALSFLAWDKVLGLVALQWHAQSSGPQRVRLEQSQEL